MNKESETAVRGIKDGDICRIAEIDALAFEHNWTLEQYIGEAAKSYAYYSVAECGGVVVGFAGIWNLYETSELVRIAVHPDFRRRKIADALLNAAEMNAKVAGCERVILEVRKSNDAARSLYEKHGFTVFSVRKGYYDGTDDALMMEKIL